MKKTPLARSTPARSFIRRLRFPGKRRPLIALLVLGALGAALIISPVMSAKSARSSAPTMPPEATSMQPGASDAGSVNSGGAVQEEGPILATDKDSYAPGETVTFTGTSWAPGEVVTIVLSQGETEGAAMTLQATADENGSFTLSVTLSEEQAAKPSGALAAKGGTPSASATVTETVKFYTATATGAASGASAQTQFREGSDADGEEEYDPDLPAFMVGKMDKEDYLRRRAEWVNKRRGVQPGKPFDPGARGRAIREMNRQEGRAEDSTSTLDSGPATFSKTAGFGDLATLAAASSSVWTSIGPAPIPSGQTFNTNNVPVSGRVTSIAIHPTNSSIAYVGAAQGGVYRTLDGGNTWTPIFDNAQTLAIGSIAIAPSQPSTIYVGTGEGNFGGDTFFGVGIYRIDNADGSSPTMTGPLNKDASGNDMLSGWGIDKIIVHPTDPNIIFFGTTSGVGGIAGLPINDTTATSTKPRALWRSTNAASASPTFQKLTAATDNGGNLSVTDVEFEPGNPNTVLACVRGTSVAGSGGVYRSTNALAATPTFTRTLAVGSSTALTRVEIGINKVGAQVTVFAATTDSSGTLKRSTDGGVTWSAAISGATGFCGGQCDYDMPVAVDPTNANIIYLGGPGDSSPAHIMIKSTNALAGTPTFSTVQTGLHADEHAIEIDPSNTSIVWTGNDGGIFKSTNGGANWTSLNNSGFIATQFQSLAVHPTDANFTIGGTQDNGTQCQGPCGTTVGNTWNQADYGDGGFALIDQSATNLTSVNMYHTYYNLTSTLIGYAYVTNAANAKFTSSPISNSWSFSGTGGSASCTSGGGYACTEAVEFYMPMAVGAGTPNPIYTGTDRLHRAATPGASNSTVSQVFVSGVPISSVGVSRQNDLVRIVGLDNGKVFRTMTGQTTGWPDVTGTIPAAYVSRAVIDPNNQNTAYVTLSVYFGNTTPHIYKTTNLNATTPTWTGIGSSIPDVPVNAFAVDPSDSNSLYAGTDIGVFRSTDGGATWSPFSNGLPRVAVFDMAVQNSSRTLRIATHGRGMWEISIGATGTLQGTVTDAATSSPISGATVTAGSNTTTTNASGFYQFSNITAATYSVTASAPGYNSGTASGVSVTGGGTTTQNFALTAAPTSGCLTDTTQADFDAGTKTNVDTTASPGSVKLAAAAPAVDQQQTNTGNAQGLSVSTTIWTGNTFTPAVTGQLSQLDASFFNLANLSGGSVVVEIRTVSGTLPTSTVLATATFAISGTTSGFYTATFSSPPTLTAGTRYSYVARTTSGSCAMHRRTNGATDYANGNAVQSTNSGSTWALNDPDVAFRTYMSTGFATSGDLISSTKDSNPAVGVTPNWTTLSWTGSAPANTTLRFQAAASNSAAGPFNFVGPDGTSATFFTSSGASLSQFNGKRYLKYRAYLSTTSSTVSPTLNDATVCYVNGALPGSSTAVNSASGTYGGTTPLSATLTSGGSPLVGKSVTFTLNGNNAGSAVTDADGVATLSSVSLAGINAGSYPSGVGASFAGDGGYTGSAGSNSLTVGKATPTVNWSNPGGITYGTALGGAQLNATASVPGSFVYTPASGAVLGAGNQTLHVDFTPTDTANYNNASKDVSISVTKAVLTITADNKSKSYREANPALTYTPTGFVNNDTAAVLSGSPSLTTTAVAASSVGTYPINIGAGDLSAANYSFSFAGGTLTVTKATPVINWSNPADITYGTALGGAQLNAVAVNPNDGSAVAGSFTYNPAQGTVPGAGNNQSLAASFAPADTDNYNTPAQKTVSVNVLKAALTVTADDKSRVYGDPNPTFTANYSGFVNGDTVSSLTGALGFNTSPVANQASPVGTYTITPGGQSSANYAITYVGGTLTITKAPLTITAASVGRLYGDANPMFTGTITGIKNGDNITAAYGTSATQGSAVGAYAIEPVAVDSSPSTLNNYAVTLVNGTLTITPRPLTIAADDKSKVYGSANPPFTATFTGFADGDSSAGLGGTLAFNTAADATSPVGAYAITPGGLSSPNYSITYVNGTLTVTKAVLTITADDKSKVYGAANPPLTFTPSGFVNGDTAASAFTGSPLLTTTATPGSTVGSYPITAGGGTLSSTNYSFTFVAGNLAVTKAVLTVTAQDKSKVYGTANPALTYTVTGFVNGDTQAGATSGQPALATTATTGSAVGSYPITAGVGTLTSSNYSFTFVGGTLSVTKAVLTITADNKTKLYGAAVPVLTYTPSGFVNGDTASVLSGAPTLGTGATAGSNVGVYPITAAAGTISAANYSFNFAGGSLSVTPAPLIIKADDKSKQYSDPLPAFTASYTGFVLGQGPGVLAGTLSLTTTATATSPANANGTPLGYPIVSGGQTSANYAITYVNGTLTVSTEAATLSYTGDSLVSPSKAGGSATVKLAALVTEEADGSLGNTLGGKTVKFSVYKSNNTSMLNADYTAAGAISSTNRTATASVSLPADNYTVKLELVANSQYSAAIENAIFTVVDPGTGITTGGGWVNDPNGGRGNFGFTVKYVGSGTPQGNNLYIYRTQADFSQYGAPAGVRDYNVIFKNNAMTAMTSKTTTTPKTAQFTGKNTVKAVDRLTGAVYDVGGGINYNFQVDVTDKSEPSSSSNPDTYALRVWTTTGNYRAPIGTYDSTGKNTAQVGIQGGNVQVK